MRVPSLFCATRPCAYIAALYGLRGCNCVRTRAPTLSSSVDAALLTALYEGVRARVSQRWADSRTALCKPAAPPLPVHAGDARRSGCDVQRYFSA
eukprot:4434998-Pleurochrysis_carterae.AAC.1